MRAVVGLVGVLFMGSGCQEALAVTSWAATAAEHRDEVGHVFTVSCPPGGQLGEVWGTDLYADESSICSAAVHAGLLTIEEGGEVTYEIRGGASIYRGSVRQGVTTGDLGPWENAFTFVRRK